MGKGIVKEDELDREWESGSMLEKSERFQTDAEWHGSVLEDIESKQGDIVSFLDDINGKLDLIYEELSKDKKPIVIENNSSQKMSLGRFITAWVLFLLAVSIVAVSL